MAHEGTVIVNIRDSRPIMYPDLFVLLKAVEDAYKQNRGPDVEVLTTYDPTKNELLINLAGAME